MVKRKGTDNDLQTLYRKLKIEQYEPCSKQRVNSLVQNGDMHLICAMVWLSEMLVEFLNECECSTQTVVCFSNVDFMTLLANNGID